MLNPPLLEAMAEVQKYYCRVYGSNEKFRICFRDQLIFKKCPIVDNLTVFLTLTAQTFSGAIWAKIPKGVVRAKIPGRKKTRS